MAISAEATRETLTVELSGVDRVWALKAALRIPRDKIASIEVLDRSQVGFGPWLRIPGTYLPGVIRHGTYGIGPKREFWAVDRQQRLLVLNIEGWSYARVVLGVPEPETLAMELQTAAR